MEYWMKYIKYVIRINDLKAEDFGKQIRFVRLN